MGCDIHSFAERRVGDKYETATGRMFKEGSEPFGWRCYGMFGFLAGVRNCSAVTPIAKARGLPDDMSEGAREEYEAWEGDAHSASWLSMAELTAFDYDQMTEDRRVTVQLAPNLWSGGETAPEGGGKHMSYRDFLGPAFFADLKALEDCGADRVVFWFDN